MHKSTPTQPVSTWSIAHGPTGNTIVLQFTTQSGQTTSLELPERDFYDVVNALQDYEVEAFTLDMGTHTPVGL